MQRYRSYISLSIFFMVTGIWAFAADVAPTGITLSTSLKAPQIDFAVGKLKAALDEQHTALRVVAEAHDASILIQAKSSAIDDDGFALSRKGKQLVVSGQSVRGAMYGVLDVAEQVRLGASIDTLRLHTVTPQTRFRAIKFNLPFAAYRDGAYLDQHQDTVKDRRFWESYLDMMAENRFNVLTLWSLHPFAYMTVPKDFPESRSFSNEEMAEYHRLWTDVFRMAKERGIETYLVNWNIFVSPGFAKAHNIATYSEDWPKFFGDGATDKIVEDYTRECVTQTIDEYPDLTGLGITFGERMGGMTPAARRGWMDRTFFAGIDAAHRPIKFIYRAPLSADTGSGGSTSSDNDRESREQIEKHAKDRNIVAPIYVEFKYNWSHGHSSPELFIVHGGKLSDSYWNPTPADYKIVWTVRNEDFLVLRWGQPDFVRQFESNNEENYVGGVILGSETYIPALDFISAPGPAKTWKYAFERQWLFYSVWGHLLYDASTPDSLFAAMLAKRFGSDTGADLLTAWKLASSVPLRFASFYQGTWDGALYTESFGSWMANGDRTLIDVNALIAHPVLDNKLYVNIADYVRSGGKLTPGKMGPLELADQIDRDCLQATSRVNRIRASRAIGPALDYEMTDIESWCAFGRYFAHKLRAGVALAQARATGDATRQAEAVRQLQQALGDWHMLAQLEARYNRLPIAAPTRAPFSWDAMTPQVEHDIELAKAPLSAAAASTSH